MGLRLAEGVDLARAGMLAGGAPPLDRNAMARLEGHGLLERDADRLRVTDKGMPVLEAILRELVVA